MRNRERWIVLLVCVAGLVARLPSAGQMVTGAGMDRFAESFGLSGSGVEVRQTAFLVNGKESANVVWPNEQPTLRFHVKAEDGYRGTVRWHVIRYGTRALPDNMWKPQVFRIAVLGTTETAVDLPPEGAFVTVRPRIGAAYGGYALVLEVPGRGRFFAATLCRTLPAEPGRAFEPTFALDLGWPHEMSPAVFNAFRKMGIKGARVEGGYNTIADAHTDWAMENNITLLLTVGCGNTPSEWQPLGRGRPWLNPDDSMPNGEKEDLAWMPQFDPQFRRYLADVLKEHGWPRGPINAVELWNEPWEGVSISGWGADSLRYREIYRVMADAVLEARREAGVKVLIGGASSSTNTRDKLFCDGTDAFLPVLDFVSIHYQALAADPALVRKWMNRQGEYGRVRVWDTESWVGNSDDRVATVIASMRAMGQDRTAGIYYGNVTGSQKHRLEGKEYAICQVWAPGAAIAAANRFIGQREFGEILFKNGLPWVFRFEGLPRRTPFGRTGPKDADDGTLVIVGDLRRTYEAERCLFRSVHIRPDARMTIANPRGEFILHDFYGNATPSMRGVIVVPLNGQGYYVRTNGAAGSFQRLLAAVKSAQVEGIDPVEIVALDMTAPIQSGPAVRLRLTNVLNRPVTGSLRVEMPGLTMASARRTVRLRGNETATLSFQITRGAPNEASTYPLRAVFESAAGRVEHAEVLRVNYISRRTIQVDGSLDDWAGCIPQTVAQAVGASVTEQAYLPFRDWSRQVSAAPITAYTAYDDRWFYFAAKAPAIVDTIRYGDRDDDSFFYPERVTDNGKERVWPAGVRRYSYRKDPDLPSGHNIQIAFNVIPEHAKPDMLPYPKGTMPRFCAYQDTDYEFALNRCKDGGTEVFCLTRVGAVRKHFYPRQPKAALDGGPVPTARLAFRGSTLECAIPLDFMPEVAAALKKGGPIRFTFRNNEGAVMELAAGRSVAKVNSLTFHNDWATHWSNSLEFGVER